MSFSLNKISLIGHLTEKPQVRQTPSGASVCDLNLQVKIKIYKEDGNVQFLPSFHTVVLWNKQAEIADQFLRSGSQVFVSGRLKTEEWDGENGQKRRKTKIIAEDIILLDSKNPLPALAENSKIVGGVNHVQIIGNLTRDPELRQTPNGTNVTSFGVATNRRWKSRDTNELQEETEFHNVVVWEGLARDVADSLKKGQKIYVAGRCTTRTWDTPDGEKRRTTEIIADQILQLGHLDEALAHGQSSDHDVDVIMESSSSNVSDEELPDIPEIKHESKIKPEDLPF